MHGKHAKLISKNVERQKQFPIFIFHPLEPIRLKWDIVISLAMVYVLVNIPIQISFVVSLPKDHPWNLTNFSVDLLFICDIIINFNTGLISESEFITSRWEIARHYLTGWFFMDAMTSIPFDQISVPGNSKISVISKIMKIFRVLRFLKLIRMVRLIKVMNSWEANDTGNVGLHRIIKFLVIMFITAHTAACFWVGIAIHYRSPDHSEENFRGWHEDSWVVRFQESWAKSIYEIYLRALYWAFTTLTTVGFGDITPVLPLEIGYTIAIQIIGSTVFGYIIGNVASLMTYSDETVLMIRSKMQAVQLYMKHRKMPPDLSNKIKSHYAYSWKQSQLFKEEEILGELPNQLRIQCALFLHKDLIENVDFFSMLEADVVPSLVACLLPMLSGPGEAVISEGLFGSEMYIISKGTLETSVNFVNSAPNSKTKIHIQTLKEGDYFADYAVIMDQAKHPLTVSSSGFCDMFHLSRIDLVQYAEHYPVAVMQIIKLCKIRYIELTKKITKKKTTLIIAVNRIVWYMGVKTGQAATVPVEQDEDETMMRLSAVIQRAQVTTIDLRWKYRQHLLRALKEAKSLEKKLGSSTASVRQERDFDVQDSTHFATSSTKLPSFKNLLESASGLGLKRKKNFLDVVGEAMAKKDFEKHHKGYSMQNLISKHKHTEAEVKHEEDATTLPRFYPTMLLKILSWKNRSQLKVAIRNLNAVERRHRNKFHLDHHFQGDDTDESARVLTSKQNNPATPCNCQGLQEELILLESTMRDEFKTMKEEFKKMSNIIFNLAQKIERSSRSSFFNKNRGNEQQNYEDANSEIDPENSAYHPDPEFMIRDCGCNIS